MPVELGECLSYHVELGLAVTLENVSVTLPEHQRHKMVGYAARTQPAGEGVPQVLKAYSTWRLERIHPAGIPDST